MDWEPPQNPSDVPLVTLDNNVFITLRRGEPTAPAVRDLMQLNRIGYIMINVTMSTALEAQRPDDQLDWEEYIAWLESLGIARDNIFTGPRTVGFATPGEPNTVTFDPWLENQLVERIHMILFPNMPFYWHAYRNRETGELADRDRQALSELEDLRYGPIRIPPRPTPELDALATDERERLHALLERLHRTWFNAKNDALGFHNHLALAWYTTHPEHAVFVTSDRNFRKQTKIAALRALGYRGEILPPAEAAAYLRATTGTSTSELTR